MPDNSAASETKYVTSPIISIRSVSVIAEWTSILHHVNSKLFEIPKSIPIATEDIASAQKSPMILNGVDVVNSTF